MKKALLIILTFSAFCLNAQTESTFENFGLSTDEFIKDAGIDGGFSDGNVFLPNNYNAAYDSWSGWAISATTDVTTPSFMNDLSAITGGGYNGSTTYASVFAFSPTMVNLEGDAIGGQVAGFYITNSTYAYLSMKDGDGFAKKFGGTTGDDPDFYVLTIKGFENGSLKNDSVDFYLGDYRFEDNSMDYLINDWTWVDLTSLGNVDSLQLSLNSSDVGAFGMNNPAYFCVDNILTTDMPTGTQYLIPETSFSVYPNPFVEQVKIEWKETENAVLLVKNLEGRLLMSQAIFEGENFIQVESFPSGHYVFEIHSNGKIAGKKMIKK